MLEEIIKVHGIVACKPGMSCFVLLLSLQLLLVLPAEVQSQASTCSICSGGIVQTKPHLSLLIATVQSSKSYVAAFIVPLVHVGR